MREHILIVDDHPLSRQTLREMLAGDYEVVETASGEEALAALRDAPGGFSAVLTDIGTGPDAGYETLALLCGAAASTQTPVVACVDNLDDDAKVRSLAMGANDFIVKPYHKEIIGYRLRNIIAAAGSIGRLRAETESLRISEEQFRIAAAVGNRVIARYDIKTETYYNSIKTLFSLGFGERVENVPQTFIDNGNVAPECINAYIAFYDAIKHGERSVTADVSLLTGEDEFRWFRCDATVLLDGEGQPSQAIIVYTDITEERERETVYRKWQQSLQQKSPESYTLFRCNLSRDTAFESAEGSLLQVAFLESLPTFNAKTLAYATQCVHPEDRRSYVALLNSDTLLANYYRNKRIETFEYRELLPDGGIRWLRLTVELVEYPNSSDVEAYMMYEDIDEDKRAEILTRELAENDPLTGVLNRAAFAQKMERLIAENKAAQHALIMLDVDGFKMLNDSFGHAAGDQALIDIAKSLRTVLRHGDLLGRLGGDEFVVCMQDVPYDAAIEKKAGQICALVRKTYRIDVQISASVGIAVYPRDGEDFDTLYRNADAALYSVKAAGKDNYACFNREMAHRRPVAADGTGAPAPRITSEIKKRRMLIVDDNAVNRKMLAKLFSDDFLIETANNGADALIRLRHYGTGFSVVLLDLIMPEMDGFAVLDNMRASVEMRSIPVVVVSGQDERETSLRAIRSGASDYVTKPVDPDLIRLRVESAISKAETERLRAQNSYLLLQSSEEAKYRTVLDSTGTVVIEYDWVGGVFTYDPSITRHIAGDYNNRKLWHILLSDMVADALDVKTMQELVHNIANDRTRMDGGMMVRLRTPSGERQWFRMRVFKCGDEFQLTDKIILTYVNVNEEVLADEKLRFQAERDDLTGLYNRKAFFEKAAEMIAAQEPGYYVISCSNINHFKVVNDQYGSQKGDEVLRQVADVFRTGFEAAGGICCRIMADNFANLYPTSFMTTKELEQVREAAAVLDGSIPPLSFSVGRYIVDDLSLSVSAMYDRAALAEAAIRGRFDVDTLLYDESMREHLLREQEIVSDMQRALRQGQFEVWLQPQYNHASGALIGAEALSRWQHPKRGLILPKEFIPVFERNGFVYELDKFVWEQACILLRKWLDQGRSPLPVSVNISRYDLFRDDLLPVITGLVETYGLPVRLLRLEITESAFAKSTDQIIRVVKSLIDYGFTVEIDDFGSGYSSLNTLKDVPAQIIKLDMRFLENKDNADRSGNVLESIVRMAKWLGMAVIAEGVETAAQADYLKSIGCIYVQGYLYAKPMSPVEYEALAKRVGKEEKLIALETVENLNSSAFWDPESMDTLIFNTYVGGACIFEWHNGLIEILRANDKYAKSIGGESCTVEDVLDLHWEEHMDETAAAATRDAIERAIETGEDATYEAAYSGLFGNSEKTWLRTTFRVIARTAGRCLLYSTNENITAQRLAEQKALAVFEQMQAVMDNVGSGITAVVARGEDVQFLFANDQYYALLGYTREQYETEVQTPFDLVHPEDRQWVQEAVEQLNATGGPESLEYRVFRRDGVMIWERNLISVTRFEGSDAPVQIAVSNDITKEKETAQQLRALNENLQNMMNDMPGGFARLRVRPDGSVEMQYVNDTYCRLRGQSREEILAAGRDDALNAVHPDDVESLRQALSEMIAGGATRRVQYRLMRTDGTYTPFTVFGRVARSDDDGSVIHAYYADMSEQEKRELSVREMVPYVLSAIMEYSTDLTFAKDREFRYICCSPAFVRFTRQKTQADVIGKTDYDFWTKEEADHFRGDDERLFESGEPLVDYIEPIPSDDGIQHYCSTSKYILRDASGAVIGMYGIGRDITETRTAFDRLRLLTNSIPGGLATYAFSPAGLRITYFNDGLCRMLGYTREEYEKITKDGVITSVFEEDRPLLQAQIDAMIADGSPVNCSYRIHNAKGDGYKWINLRLAAAEQQGDTLIANAVLYDVTEAKLAEEAARIHEQEMRLAMSQMGRMICEYDPATRTLTVPDAYAERYDRPAVMADVPDAVIRKGVIDEATLPAYRGLFEAILRGDESGHAEYRELRSDGSWDWERAEFSTVFDSNGKPVKTIIAVEDTTQLHLQYEIEQSRPSLDEGNLLIHALFNLSTLETLDYTYGDGREVPISERTAFIYGGENLETVIINDDERAHYRAINDPKQLLAHFKKGETELSLDYRRRMPDGEIIWARNLLRMMRAPGGSDVLLFEYCYNVEEEKTQALMYNALVSDNYDYVARINGRNRRFVIIANMGVQYGMPPPQGNDLDAAIRKIAKQAVHPEDREMVIKNTCVAGIRKNLATGDRFQFTCRLVRPDGEIRYKKISAYYLDREREIIIMTREDVSSVVREEMHKSEQLLDALAAANQANRAKSQFLSRMSHELRTPMNAIIGLSALTAAEVNDPRAVEDSIGKIGMSARYLLSLINDILEMSRIESGRMTLNEAVFDFERLIAEVNNIVIAQADAKSLDYDAIVKGYTEPSYVGDATKLQEILVNVLGNAVKFTPPGGKVTLTIEQLRCTKKRATLRFTIADTGIGIDESFLPQLFEPFAQESDGFFSSSSGTGLGLAITKTLVDMMSGRITVKSIKNVGSVFTIELQLGISSESRHYLDMVAAMQLEKLRALVVDDDVSVCKSTEGILRTMGIQAEWVASGRQAVERVKAVHADKLDFDTIFIDWKMPDMDGVETTRHIRKIVGPDVTIIIMTAYDWKEIETEAREAGVDLFIEKPLFQSSILKAFERMYAADADRTEAAATAPDFSGKRILLAEDHPLNIEVARRLLTNVGAEVVVVNNGLEAIETFATEADGHFDAILMDIRMPVMDGLTAAKNIRSLKKAGSKAVPIIAMTANAFDEDVEMSLASGMNAHLTKPIEPQVLFQTLKRLMKD